MFSFEIKYLHNIKYDVLIFKHAFLSLKLERHISLCKYLNVHFKNVLKMHSLEVLLRAIQNYFMLS